MMYRRVAIADEIIKFKIPQNNFAVMDAVMIQSRIRENFAAVTITAFWGSKIWR